MATLGLRITATCAQPIPASMPSSAGRISRAGFNDQRAGGDILSGPPYVFAVTCGFVDVDGLGKRRSVVEAPLGVGVFHRDDSGSAIWSGGAGHNARRLSTLQGGIWRVAREDIHRYWQRNGLVLVRAGAVLEMDGETIHGGIVEGRQINRRNDVFGNDAVERVDQCHRFRRQGFHLREYGFEGGINVEQWGHSRAPENNRPAL